MWTETAPGSGRWTGPQQLGGGPLVPHLAVSLTKDGRWQLFGERIAGLGPDPDGNRREIVALEQTRPGGPFGTWTSLGNPERDPVRGRHVGAPVVARNADGTAQVFVRDWAKGVSTRRQLPGGAWTDWKGLPAERGLEVQEGLAAVTAADGRVHLVGAGHDTVHHWVQDRPGGELAPARGLALPAPADPPALLAQPDGSLLLLYREPRTSRPLAHRLGTDGGWEAQDLDIAGRGHGLMAVATDPAGSGSALLVTRNDNGGLSTTSVGPGADPRWSDVAGVPRGPVVGTPSVTTDARGRLVVATLTAEGTLWTSTRGAGEASHPG